MEPFVRTVQITNYKSIAKCRVDLGPLVFLVGPNGSGKSNFLDALRFVADSLNVTLEQSLRDRGGISSVRRRSRGHPNHFGMRLSLTMADGRRAWYGFKVGAEREGGFVVQREECHVSRKDPRSDLPKGIGFDDIFIEEDFYVVREGVLEESSQPIRTALERDRLALVALSGHPEFRAVYEGLRRMAFYNLNPERIRDLQEPDAGQVLARDGRNLAAVVRELTRTGGGETLSRVVEHLRAVVPGVVAVEHETLGPKETLKFRQQVEGDSSPWRFYAAEMSDGTLRSLGILVAALQGGLNGQRRVSLVGIEEPEMALHPGAAEIIGEVLLLASEHVQIVATTHSPELLNHKSIREDHLLAVTAENGRSVIGPIEPGARSVIHDRLYSPGELLSQGSIEPDRRFVEENLKQLRLFNDSVE